MGEWVGVWGAEGCVLENLDVERWMEKVKSYFMEMGRKRKRVAWCEWEADGRNENGGEDVIKEKGIE